MKQIKGIPKICLIGLGCIFTVLGIIGFVLPLMPGFVFLLLASFCFSRSSERFHNWLLNNPMFGQILRDYLDGKGISVTAKRRAIFVIWTCIAISAYVAAKLIVTVGLIAVAAGVSWYLIKLPSYHISKKQTP